MAKIRKKATLILSLQNVKGKVSDKATGIGLPGVVVKLKNDTSKKINAQLYSNWFVSDNGIQLLC